MDILWAPWRSKYIYSRKKKRCIFCGNKTSGKDSENVIDRSVHSYSMLNIYPYNNCHVMVAPKRHVKSLDLLSPAELKDLIALLNRTKKLIDRKFKPDGYNIGMNIGKVAGAGFAGHIHIHIVPRWHSDSNFMPVVSNTRVISESLKAVAEILKKGRHA